MTRIRIITRPPAKAADVTPEVKLDFLADLLVLAIPLFEGKGNDNPE